MQRFIFMLVMLPLVSLLPACVGSLPPAGVMQLKQIDTTYRQGDYHGAVIKADEFLALYASTEAAGEAYYLRGLSYASLKDKDRAREDFEQAIQNAHRADLAPLAHVALGNMAFEDGHLTQAAQQYQPAVDKLPNEAPKDLVLYRLGVCYTRQGQWRAGRTWFSQLITLFPASSMEPAARQYLAADAFTIQCGAYLEFAEADKQVKKLRDGGLAEVRWVQDPRMKYHLVQVGNYGTYQEARTGLAQVLRIVPDAIIVP